MVPLFMVKEIVNKTAPLFLCSVRDKRSVTLTLPLITYSWVTSQYFKFVQYTTLLCENVIVQTIYFLCLYNINVLYKQ